MKAKELKDKTLVELEQKLHSLKEELFHLRYRARTGRLEKPSLIRKIKRDIARINTVMREIELTVPGVEISLSGETAQPNKRK